MVNKFDLFRKESSYLFHAFQFSYAGVRGVCVVCVGLL